ncbi:hypothetical protein QA635_09070 [Bradyrhizobium brasilense]|uniref:hypothetical protein n=1 Tax=Bradyrhizobium brasilense TaxID=1419277 RepID=UPI0024B097CB|nr:hypothetical protein [Bradyrhizobium australafricanum]WFU34531.1 hypothetical protein QA635_09070 [Bradyrhizobium australafricanum]
MTKLTRRRDKEAAREKWSILYRDVVVGSIGLRKGVPNHADQWEWKCGFYPGSDRSTGEKSGEGPMNDLLNAGDGEHKPPRPHFQACFRCGGITSAMSILDSRQGKSYRLRRCLGCEKLS